MSWGNPYPDYLFYLVSDPLPSALIPGLNIQESGLVKASSFNKWCFTRISWWKLWTLLTGSCWLCFTLLNSLYLESSKTSHYSSNNKYIVSLFFYIIYWHENRASPKFESSCQPSLLMIRISSFSFFVNLGQSKDDIIKCVVGLPGSSSISTKIIHIN